MSLNDHDPMLPQGTDKCQCPTCKEYFNSTYAFDKHRKGPINGARRCLSGDELRADGWIRTKTGHWATAPRSVDREPPEPDGECFRGGEAAAYEAEQQAWIQRNLK